MTQFKHQVAPLLAVCALAFASFTANASPYSMKVPIRGLRTTPPPASALAWDTPTAGNTVSGVVATFQAAGYGARAMRGASSGKWYWEFTTTTVGLYPPQMGIAPAGIASGVGMGSPNFTNGVSWYPNGANGHGCVWSSCGFSSMINAAPGDVFGFALDVDAATMQWYYNGTLIATTTGITTAKPWYPAASNPGATPTNVVTANFGTTPFKYSVPTGYTQRFSQ